MMQATGTSTTMKPDAGNSETLQYTPTMCLQFESRQLWTSFDRRNATAVTEFLGNFSTTFDVIDYLGQPDPVFNTQFLNMLALAAHVIIDIQRLNNYLFSSEDMIELVGEYFIANLTSQLIRLQVHYNRIQQQYAYEYFDLFA